MFPISALKRSGNQKPYVNDARTCPRIESDKEKNQSQCERHQESFQPIERERETCIYGEKNVRNGKGRDHLRCLDISVRNSAARLSLRGIVCRKPKMQNPQTSPRPKLTKRKKHYTRPTPTHFMQLETARERERERKDS